MKILSALLLVASTSAFCSSPSSGYIVGQQLQLQSPRSLTEGISHPSRPASTRSRTGGTRLFAKKKKAKKKDKQQKQSGFEWAASFSLKPYEAQSTRDLVSTAVASYEGRTGKPLCEDIVGVSDIPKSLWKAPIACLIVDQTDGGGTAVEVKYANLAALETVGLTADQWGQLITVPGPKAEDSESAPSKMALELPAEMKDKAYESGYQKKIQRKDKLREDGAGHDIGILDAERWKLEKSALVDGAFVTVQLGVAYAWKEWVLDDTTVCAPGGKRRETGNMDDLQEAVDQQAGLIRDLKENQGLGNKDSQVQDAVAELLRLKALLGASQ